MKQHGFARKMDDMSNHLSSSPRRIAIGKPSLRLSIPTIEQIAETKNQNVKLNQTDSSNKKSGSFVKQMIDNCNHSSQLPSNVEVIVNNDGQSKSGNAADVCDTNRVKRVIEKLDKTTKQMTNTNGKSPTETTMASIGVDVNFDVDEKPTRKSSINIYNDDKNTNDKHDMPCTIELNGAPQQLDNFLSYSKFENDFKKRINELNASRIDTKPHGMDYIIHITTTMHI